MNNVVFLVNYSLVTTTRLHETSIIVLKARQRGSFVIFPVLFAFGEETSTNLITWFIIYYQIFILSLVSVVAKIECFDENAKLKSNIFPVSYSSVSVNGMRPLGLKTAEGK